MNSEGIQAFLYTPKPLAETYAPKIINIKAMFFVKLKR